MFKKNLFFILVFFLCLNLFSRDSDFSKKISELSNNIDISNDSLFNLLKHWDQYAQPDSTGVYLVYENIINDTLTAPYVVYIPTSYDLNKKTPILVYLHGGVSMPDFIDKPIEYAQDNPSIPFAENNNWLMLFPLGNIHTMWWDIVGIENIKSQINSMKEKFNIDDDRIYITGFSDGGSASFHFALNDPSYFAAFYPLNGMISVGHRVTNIPVFLQNLQNRHLRVINTDEDALYPSEEMGKLMDLASQAGADLLYKEYWGIGHSFEYAEEEIPLMIEDMKNQSRNIFNNNIYWETSIPEFGRTDWIEIIELDTLELSKPWQKEYNVKLVKKRIQFGFYHDQNFEGKGVLIRDIVENSASEEMGLQKNDIIMGMDNIITETLDSLLYLRNKKKRGDTFSLTVLRDNEEIQLNGQFPEEDIHDAFQYNLPSGAVKARYWGNHFELETSRVKKIAIYIHPDMVNLENPVSIIVNGKEMINELIEINRYFLIDNFLKNKDRTALWTNKIILDID
jgi:predicted esterase